MNGDPLRDPQFPDRPQTLDFWRLSETILMLDGRTDGGTEVGSIVAEFVDVQSALYMSDQRVRMLIRNIGIAVSEPMRVLVLTAYMGGLTHGIAFEKAGGHRGEQVPDNDTIFGPPRHMQVGGECSLCGKPWPCNG